MLTRDDADRIADAITGLRGEWNRPQLLAVMGDPRIRLHRQPKDVAAALAWCALDADTRQPTRIFEAGPWWGTTTPTTAVKHVRTIEGTDCAICFLPESSLHLSHEYEPQHARTHSVGMTAEQRQAIQTALAAAENDTNQEDK